MIKPKGTLHMLISVLGIIVGVGAIIAAVILKGISFTVFINPAAICVILVGTVACILNAFPGGELKNLGSLFKILFSSTKEGRKADILKTMEELAAVAHKEGLLALDARIENLDDNFMKKGLRMAVDGLSPEYILEVLSVEMEQIEERHHLNASIFSQAGMYAPTLGVLGAVFGLIAAMSHIDDTDMMAEAVAAAFIATILGIFTGYVLWNPFANKLKVKTAHEMVEKRMIIEGILSIQKGEFPAMVKSKLVSFLSDSERAKLPAEIAGERA
jgi:chemotaxis protein MotA